MSQSSPTHKANALRSVRIRLTLWNAGVMTLLLCVLGIILRTTLAGDADQRGRWQSRRLRELIFKITWSTAERLSDVDPAALLSTACAASRRARTPIPSSTRKLWIRLLGENGQPLTPDAAGRPPRQLPDSARPLRGTEQSIRTIHVGSVPVRVLSEPVTRNGAPLGVLQLNHRLEDTYAQIDRVTGVLLALDSRGGDRRG